MYPEGGSEPIETGGFKILVCMVELFSLYRPIKFAKNNGQHPEGPSEPVCCAGTFLYYNPGVQECTQRPTTYHNPGVQECSTPKRPPTSSAYSNVQRLQRPPVRKYIAQ